MSIRTEPSHASASDKRYFPRWNLNNHVCYALDDQDMNHEGRTRDLSCSGACLSIHEPITPHQRIRLKINLADEAILRLQGEIIWVRPQVQISELGVAFYNTDKECQDLILKYAFEFKHREVVKNWFRGWENP